MNTSPPARAWAEHRRKAILGGCALLAICVLGIAALAFVPDRYLSLDAFETLTRDLGPWGPAAVIALMVLHSFVPFPAELIALAAGAVYGMTFGATLIWIGGMLGATLSFALARAFGRPFAAVLFSQRKLEKLDRWTAGQGAAGLIAVRLMPIVAFNIVNYAAGLAGVRWRLFLWTTGIGILPITLICAAFGEHMRAPGWEVTAALVAAAAATILAGRWLHRRAQPEGKRPAADPGR